MKNNSNLTIKQWAPEDRPCEKIQSFGAAALSDAELLAVLIGSGTKGRSAVEVARELLASFKGSLNAIGKARFDELGKTAGIGLITACRIAAAVEIGKRRQKEDALADRQLTTATRLYSYMLPIMKDLAQEEAHVILMNQSFGLIRSFCLAKGGISEVTVDIRVIMREAVLSNATVIALAHNHPSGACRPSHEDDKLTMAIGKACQAMRIFFADHIIVCDGQYFSYKENGKL